ncbi:MAG: prepilin peptidase [Kiloniellaceae bacterium]
MDAFYVQVLYVVFGLYSLLLGVAAVYDSWKFVIPNAVTVALVVLFVATALVLPFEVDWLSHIGAALAVFAGGALLYGFKKLGAGDVKLLTAVALWAGFEHLPELLLYVTLGGGALALTMMVLRRILMGLQVARPELGKVQFPRVLLDGEAIPYALAIAPSSIILGVNLPHLGGYLI